MKEGDKASFSPLSMVPQRCAPSPPPTQPRLNVVAEMERRAQKWKRKGKEKGESFLSSFLLLLADDASVWYDVSISSSLFYSCPFAPPANLSARKGIGDCDGAGKVCFPPSGPPLYGTSRGGPIKEFRLGALGGRRRGGKRVIKARYPLLLGPDRSAPEPDAFMGGVRSNSPLRVGEVARQ